MDGTPLAQLILEAAAFLAMASLLTAAAGLLAVRCARRSAPLRHGLLLGTLAVLLFLPAAPFAATLVDTAAMPALRSIVEPVAERVKALAEPVAHTNDYRAATSGATGSTSAISTRTLTADEIPAGAVLPGQRTAGLNPAARAAVATRTINVTAAGLASVAAWLIGTLVSLLLTLRGARRVAGIVRRSPVVADVTVLAVHETLARQLGLRRAPALRSSAVVGVPFAWGLRRPVVVIPESLVNAGQESRLRAILQHELAHVCRRDAWIGLLQRLAAALYWCNPLVHRLNARLAEARELICDAHVLASGCPPRDYAEVLVELAAQITLPQPATALSLVSRSQPQLTRRVQHLLEDPPMSTSLRSIGRLCVMGLIIVGTTAVVLVAAAVFPRDPLSRQTWNPRAVSQPAIRNSYQPAPQIAVPAAQPAAELFADLEPVAEPVLPTMGMEPVADPDPFATPEDTLTLSPPLVGGDGPFFGTGDEDFAPPADAPFYPGTPVDGGDAPRANPTPNHNWPPKGGPQFIGQGSIHALAAIDLVAGDDGGLKEVRWFTESLGTGEEATLKLGERLKQFAETQPSTVFRLEPRQTNSGTIYVAVPIQVSPLQSGEPGRGDEDFVGNITPNTPLSPIAGDEDFVGPAFGRPSGGASGPFQRVLAAQITASPQLRYEHVARVIALCEAHVERVIIGQLDMSADLKLTLGFVRDGSGNKISSSPVLIWNDAIISRPVVETVTVNGRTVQKTVMATVAVPDKIVEVHSLPPLLMNWRHLRDPQVDRGPKSLTALIRADDGVDPALVEQVVQAVLPAGIERVVLEPLAIPAAEEPPQVEEAETAPVVEPDAPVVQPATGEFNPL